MVGARATRAGDFDVEIDRGVWSRQFVSHISDISFHSSFDQFISTWHHEMTFLLVRLMSICNFCFLVTSDNWCMASLLSSPDGNHYKDLETLPEYRLHTAFTITLTADADDYEANTAQHGCRLHCGGVMTWALTRIGGYNSWRYMHLRVPDTNVTVNTVNNSEYSIGS